MKQQHEPNDSLAAVQAVYSGPEGKLWELLMGQQIHIGGLASSMDLARKAGIQPGTQGVDFCCCTGAGMRFLARFCNVASMTGVDATEAMVQLGRQRCREEGLAERIRFIQADVCNVPMPDQGADFVWGEDAWCYVKDKPTLIAEACRLVRPGGTIAFTDWLLGAVPMSEDEMRRTLAFMKFSNIQSLAGYAELLKQNGCAIVHLENTGRFADHAALYRNMVTMQLTYDALKIIEFELALLEEIGREIAAMEQLARKGKLIQGLIVARKKA
jgi:ubiquinone/menaquinone biosynthesis C-methylase UbiE